MDKFVVIPACSDLNRGDQALVWETKRIAEDSGFKGKFYLTAEKDEPTQQSENLGFGIISPMLEHPSRKFKRKNNTRYTAGLKIRWGIVALLDLLSSLFILSKYTRWLGKYFLSPDKKRALEVFESARAIFVKGGGLFQTYGGISSTYSMYFWTYSILLAHSLKKPVIVLPNSFGPFKGPFVSQIAKLALKKCKLLTARESISQQVVAENLNLKTTNYPDLAFCLKESTMDKDGILSKYKIPKNKKIVALTMRPFRFPKSDAPELAYDTFKEEMGIFINWLSDQGYMPVIVEHTLAVNAHENDGACIREVTENLSDDKYRIISNKDYDCRDLKAIYGICDYIVGTRFHSMIFSFGMNVPGIAIAYTGNKTQGIMHDMDLDDYVVDIYQISAAVLQKKFLELVANRNEVQSKISHYTSNAFEKRGTLVNELHKIENQIEGGF